VKSSIEKMLKLPLDIINILINFSTNWQWNFDFHAVFSLEGFLFTFYFPLLFCDELYFIWYNSSVGMVLITNK